MIARLKARVGAKLRGKRGESIGETLIALLISSLALVMLAGAISSAANIVTRGKDVLVAKYAASGEDGTAKSDIQTNRSAWEALVAAQLPTASAANPEPEANP